MKKITIEKYFVLILCVVFSISASLTYAYFDVTINKENVNDTDIITNEVSIDYDEANINIDYFAPIYDETYETASFQKSFSFTNTSDLGGCTTVTLDINNISSELMNSYLKYKLVRNDGEIFSGGFDEIQNNKIVMDSFYIEANESKSYVIYIWLSYDENVNQINMLGKKLNSKIVVSVKPTRNSSSCVF